MSKKLYIPIIIIIGIGGLAGYFLVRYLDSGDPSMGDAYAVHSPSLVDPETLNQLHQSQSSPIDVSHVGTGLVPPTNKWFSGFALQQDPKPGFSYPNSYRPLTDGFEMGLPSVTATGDTISGPHRADVVVTIEGATRYQLTRYDELTLDLSYFSATGEKLATLTLGSGLPYAFLSAETDIQVTTNLPQLQARGQAATAVVSDKSYGVYNSGGAVRDLQLKVARNDFLTFFSAPDQKAAAQVARSAGNKVTSGTVSYRVAQKHTTTELSYVTANRKPTMVARMPHQSDDAKARTNTVRYQSIYGDLPVEATSRLSYSTKTIPVVPTLDIATLSPSDKAVLVEQLSRDIQTTKLDKPDTYFGGKQLYRAAQLLDIAAQLQQKDGQKIIQTKLRTALDAWFSENKSSVQSLAYNTRLHGIIGNQASFGSDTEFNDHYFHYGYFIYAASILAKYDPSFVKSHGDTVNLLVADIANYKTGETLPLRRNFDPYAGHGWASGIAPFQDGNNQESSSEAINAWAAVALWAQTTDNKTLETEGLWMLSNEVATAQKYWLQTNPTNASYLKSYTAPLVSINWGGKRGYQTFFSNEPNAKLGIQLIPMSPTLSALMPAVADRNLSSIDPQGMFGDYITMAQAGDTSLEDAKKLPDSAIDDGDSRTYLYAWMLTHGR